MDIAIIRKLIALKVSITSLLARVGALQRIQSAWDTDDDEIETDSLRLKLACEYTASELEPAQQLCQEILVHPPAYADRAIANPDELLFRCIELEIRVERAWQILRELHGPVEHLEGKCEQLAEMEEVVERVSDSVNACEMLVTIAKELVGNVQAIGTI